MNPNNDEMQMKYFVLSPFSSDKLHAEASKKAVRAYAEMYRDYKPEMTKQILQWIGDDV